MYQFYAEHVAEAVEAALDKGVAMQIVLDPQTRDPQSGKTATGDFEQSDTFNKWAKGSKFDRIFVPLGSNGLVAKAYHIKVTVRDQSPSGCRAETGPGQVSLSLRNPITTIQRRSVVRATANGTW